MAYSDERDRNPDRNPVCLSGTEPPGLVAGVLGWRSSWAFRRIVADSVEILRTEARLSLNEILHTPPITPLGRLGVPQEFLYRVVRATRPAILVETGAYQGISSAFIFSAIRDNELGRLINVDLPSGSFVDPMTGRVGQSLLFDKEQIGFAVPDEIRGRWTLLLGNVHAVLLRVPAEHPSIDMIYHDREHTYDTMMWGVRRSLFSHL